MIIKYPQTLFIELSSAGYSILGVRFKAKMNTTKKKRE